MFYSITFDEALLALIGAGIIIFQDDRRYERLTKPQEL